MQNNIAWHREELNICYHNVCIEIESLGYLFIFKLSALGDKDKSDFVLYIIGEHKIWQLTPQEQNHSD